MWGRERAQVEVDRGKVAGSSEGRTLGAGQLKTPKAEASLSLSPLGSKFAHRVKSLGS